jgi:hypothetical protein
MSKRSREKENFDNLNDFGRISGIERDLKKVSRDRAKLKEAKKLRKPSYKRRKNGGYTFRGKRSG